MRCPKDADRPTTSIDNWCGATTKRSNQSMWVCTRKAGHKGMHHSHDQSKHCNIKWK